MDTPTSALYPRPSKTVLQEAYVGKPLKDIPTPAAVLDRAIVQRHCQKMLQTCKHLGVDFRAHVKTHKTAEVTRLQIGNSKTSARIVVSTLVEAEHLIGSRHEWIDGSERQIDVLYGVPLPPSQAQRLGNLARMCGHGGLSLLIDHVDQLEAVQVIRDLSGYMIDLFIKVDTGYHRAGVKPGTTELESIIHRISATLEPSGSARLCGFYSHAGHSYNTETTLGSLHLLQEEIEGLIRAAETASNILEQYDKARKNFVLSVGATPSATSVQDIISNLNPGSKFGDQAHSFLKFLERVKSTYFIELHAGVYSILDLQQLATRTKSPALGTELLTSDIALTILAEIASVYPDREEALLAAGTLALGREPCKSYPGWGKVTPWNTTAADSGKSTNLMIGRISQEHALLTRDEGSKDSAELHVGQKIRIWPNHACVAGAGGYGWYLIVDSTLPEDQRDTVVDVWVRCRGW